MDEFSDGHAIFNSIDTDKLYVSDKDLSFFKPPPEANVKITLGNHTNAWIQFYSDSPPNVFQRWVLKMFTGIKVEKITK